MIFKLQITKPFGLERPDQERMEVRCALQSVADVISAAHLSSGVIKSRDGSVIGSYEFGPGSLNRPG